MHMLTSLIAKGRGSSPFARLVILGLMLLCSATVSAAVSPFCPPQSLTVSNGGSVTSANLATCDLSLIHI